MIRNLLSTVFIALMLGLIYYMVNDMYQDLRKRPFRGVIQELYRTPGYRGETESHVTFYSDSLKRRIDVVVPDNLYVNLKVGDTTNIPCSLNDLRR